LRVIRKPFCLVPHPAMCNFGVIVPESIVTLLILLSSGSGVRISPGAEGDSNPHGFPHHSLTMPLSDVSRFPSLLVAHKDRIRNDRSMLGKNT